jgi:aquaporin Z
VAAGAPASPPGFLTVSLAFGLTVLTMAYAIGHISGCHLKPAVTVGLAVAGRFPKNEMFPYIVAQCAGAILGAGILFVICVGNEDFTLAGGFAANGFAEHSPGGYSVNPARSLGPAIFVGDWAISQLWLFWLAPILGAVAAGITYPYISAEAKE